MGVPVTYVRSTPRAAPVARWLTVTTVASRATRRTLRPGITLPSHSTLGMRRTAAASSTGMAT